MPLSDVELRVLGALIEKDRTTPDSYPLSIQALVTACNQRTSREPVTDLHLQEVMAAVNRLKDRGLAETVQEVGDRVPKHRHKAMAALDLDGREVAVLAVLLLRGAQTPGELRSRTERYADFPDVAAVEATLQRLTERTSPLVLNQGRAAGQSQDRWAHTLGADEGKMVPRARPARFSDGRDGTGEPGRRVRTDGGSERRDGTEQGVAASGGAPDGERELTATESYAPVDEYAELTRRLEALEQRVKLLETRI